MPTNTKLFKIAHALGAVWGIAGVTLLLGSAVLRLTPHIEDALDTGLSSFQWSVLAVWSAFMIVSEGYRGFQKLFSPRVAARTWHLTNHGRPFDLVLAPFYVVGYFQATKKRIITSWCLTVVIVLLVILTRQVAQPWRGIIDSGVVLGLLYGLVWVYVFVFRTLKTRSYVVNPEVPPLP